MKLYTIKETSSVLRLSPQTVRKLIKSGQLKAIRVGWRGWRVKEEDLEKYLEEAKNGNKF